jgi:outer membrane protein assembly factor BamD
MIFFRLIPCLCVLLLASCAKPHTDPYKDFRHLSAKTIYSRGVHQLAVGDYTKAISSFEALVGVYPFGQYAQPGQLDLIYAYYKTQQKELAVATADRYIQLYPQGKNVDYAYYMRGLVQFTQGLSWMQQAWGTDPAGRDLRNKQQAFLAFAQLVRFYPHSRFVPNALAHMQYIRNVFSRHQLLVARYNWDRGAYVAAANRAAQVVRHYQGTPSVKPALVLMVRAYRRLGEMQLANQTLQVLQASFPNTRV